METIRLKHGPEGCLSNELQYRGSQDEAIKISGYPVTVYHGNFLVTRFNPDRYFYPSL